MLSVLSEIWSLRKKLATLQNARQNEAENIMKTHLHLLYHFSEKESN